DCDNLWWDAFTTEFFEDDAVLTVACCLEDGPKRYTIGRTLIPRYFRSIFDGGATDLYFNLKHSKESFHGNLVILDCDLCSMVTLHNKPIFTKVCTEGRLYLEFTFDDLMRIKNWHFNIRQNRELLSRSILATHAQDPPMLEQLSNSITRSGLTNFTLNYLRNRRIHTDVMIVGEPALMGGELGDEDERLITRLENGQYDAANGLDEEEDFRNLPALGTGSPWSNLPHHVPFLDRGQSPNPRGLGHCRERLAARRPRLKIQVQALECNRAHSPSFIVWRKNSMMQCQEQRVRMLGGTLSVG
ncbi:hypothetical protein scyTo_0020830, partial [Scyliorhinus torazame]|nr:hypothetical protein [Scyliorhinus torazame]